MPNYINGTGPKFENKLFFKVQGLKYPQLKGGFEHLRHNDERAFANNKK